MGEFANTRLTSALAIAATAFVCLLNGILLLTIAGVAIPFADAEYSSLSILYYAALSPIAA
jgi:hypothetical protein